MENGILDAIRKFFSPKDQVHRHWYSPLDGFQFSSTEFYSKIESELNRRKVPGLDMVRLEVGEGGLLSHNREYLRLKRERLVFDICAAPFGTGYFFSFRLVELPLGMKPWELFVAVVGFGLAFGSLFQLLGFIYGTLAFIILFIGSCWLLRNSIALGLHDLDAALVKTRVIGPIYELFFRKETYYREDTRQMYLTVVNSITEALVSEVTAAKGIKKLKRFDREPVHGLYHEQIISTQDNTPEAK